MLIILLYVHIITSYASHQYENKIFYPCSFLLIDRTSLSSSWKRFFSSINRLPWSFLHNINKTDINSFHMITLLPLQTSRSLSVSSPDILLSLSTESPSSSRILGNSIVNFSVSFSLSNLAIRISSVYLAITSPLYLQRVLYKFWIQLKSLHNI